MSKTRPTPGPGEAGRLLAPLADLASAAGARIVEITAQDASVRFKADRSPVTAADEAAESILCNGLARLLPGVPIIAEEAVSRDATEHPQGTYLLVDPVDGTRELVAGRGEYTVNVALIDRGAPLLGVVYAPALHALYAGAESHALLAKVEPGAKFDASAAVRIRARSRPAQLLALVSRSHPDPASDAFLASLPLERKVPLGSSLKFARLAEGAADVYARFASVNEWDIAAGHALLAAAGGTVTATDGAAIDYGARSSGFRVDGFIAWGGPPEA